MRDKSGGSRPADQRVRGHLRGDSLIQMPCTRLPDTGGTAGGAGASRPTRCRAMGRKPLFDKTR